MKKLFLISALLFTILAVNAQNAVIPVGAESDQPAQSGEEIAKALDGNNNTIYHSSYSSNAIPNVIDFYFYGTKSVNEIRYRPRASGTNGIWTTVDVYYATVDNPSTFILKSGDVAWSANNTVKVLNYTAAPIIKPAVIRFVVKAAVGNFSSCAEMNFLSAETGTVVPTPDCAITTSMAAFTATKIAPTSVAANTQSNTAENAAKSMDNNFATFYHSSYGYVVSPTNTARLTYTFTGSPSIDYLIYHPRSDGGNGRFGDVDIYYKLQGQSTFTFGFSYSAGQKNAPSIMQFPTTLNNVLQIEVRVKTGSNNNASCAEMEFYQNVNLDASVSGNVFTDNLFNALKPGTTLTEIDAIPSSFFKELATCMFNGTYKYKYRSQEYRPVRSFSTLATQLKTSNFNQYENPTGMAFTAGTEVVIFVGGAAPGVGVSLKLADLRTHTATGPNYVFSNYALKSGFNVIQITTDGLGYIDYSTDNPDVVDPVKVHIAKGGTVNGIYNLATDSRTDWIEAVNTNTSYSQIDLRGKYVSLLFDKTLLKKYNPANIEPLVNTYDSIVKIQFNMMGIYKHNIKFSNTLFALGHNMGGLYAGGLGMHFDYSWGEANYVSVNGVLNGDIWGVAHEIGHINQARPSLKWAGMTEVSNNIFSTYTEYTMGVNKGLNGRLERESADPTSPGGGEDVGTNKIVGGRIKGFMDRTIVGGANHMNNNVFGRVLPIWQLQLYYQFAGALRGAPTLQQRVSGVALAPAAGVVDYAHFLGDVSQLQRIRNDASASHETLMLNFVKDVCDVTKEDLTDFFIKTGFLKPIDTTFDDYGSKNYKITQAAIDAAVASIKDKGYQAPVSPVIYYLSANSLNAFKGQLLASGTYKVGTTLNGTLLTINHTNWRNVVAFETYNSSDKLLEVNLVGARNVNNTTTVINYPANADWVYAISYDGSKKLVYSRSTVLPVKLTTFEAKLVGNGAQLKWTTSSEKNNKKFEIYRSIDGLEFTKIAEVAGNGNKETATNYQYLDRDFKQLAYYKLVQVDFDNVATSYDDEVRFVKGLDETQELIVYPNPTANKVYVQGISSATAVKVIDVMGKTVKAIKIDGKAVAEIDFSALPSGIYNIQLVSQNGVAVKKIVKQ